MDVRDAKPAGMPDEEAWAGSVTVKGLIAGLEACPVACDLCGLALVFADGRFRIQAVGPDGEAVLSFGPYGEDDVVAIWRSLAAASGLPLLIAGGDGQLSQPYRQLGRVVLGERRDRARLAVLSGRRPRFLAKRRPGRLSPWPTAASQDPERAGGRGD